MVPGDRNLSNEWKLQYLLNLENLTLDSQIKHDFRKLRDDFKNSLNSTTILQFSITR